MDIDEITRELMRTRGSVRMSTSDLTSLAKQASQEYLVGGTSLNDAIIKVAREHPGITADQLQRVVEYANNETFQALFEKQAGDKNVKFPLADTREILRSLDIQARPSGYELSDDYSSDPEKLAAKNPIEADLVLMEMFGISASTPAMQKAAEDMISGGKADDKGSSDFSAHQMEIGRKVEREHTTSDALASEIVRDHLAEDPAYYTNAKERNWGEHEIKKEAMALIKTGAAGSAEAAKDLLEATSLQTIKTAAAKIGQYEEANPYGELVRTRQTIVKLADDAKAADSRNRVMLKEAMDSLTHEVKQFLLQGGNLGEVVDAMGSIHTGDRVKEAMEYVVPILEKHGFDRIRARADMIRYEMVKKAHRVVNPDNPIVTAFGAMLKLASGQEKLTGAVEDLEEGLKQINERIKRAHHVA